MKSEWTAVNVYGRKLQLSSWGNSAVEEFFGRLIR